VGRRSTPSSATFQQLNFSNIGMAWSALSRSEVAAGSLAALVFALGLVVVYLVLSAQYGSYYRSAGDPDDGAARHPRGVAVPWCSITR